MHMQLTSLYAVMQHMQTYIGRASPIRKDVAANWPNWLLEGVVGCHPFHSYCCRSGGSRRCCSLSLSPAVAMT